MVADGEKYCWLFVYLKILRIPVSTGIRFGEDPFTPGTNLTMNSITSSRAVNQLRKLQQFLEIAASGHQ